MVDNERCLEILSEVIENKNNSVAEILSAIELRTELFKEIRLQEGAKNKNANPRMTCLLYTSDAADE